MGVDLQILYTYALKRKTIALQITVQKLNSGNTKGQIPQLLVFFTQHVLFITDWSEVFILEFFVIRCPIQHVVASL